MEAYPRAINITRAIGEIKHTSLPQAVAALRERGIAL
jgi:hypothetical protein